MKEKIIEELREVEQNIKDMKNRLTEQQLEVAKDVSKYSNITTDCFVDLLETRLGWIKHNVNDLKELELKKKTLEELIIKY